MNRFYIIIKFLLDKSIPLKEKWWVIIPLIYIVSPADLIPAPVLGFSIIDDAVVLAFLLSIASGKTKKYHNEHGAEYKGKEKEDIKNVVEDVEYEIKKDED